jgi:dTDP-L-rhamnose 4-epimerase
LYETILAKPELRKKIKKIVVASSKSVYGEGAYACKTCGAVNPPLRPQAQLERHDWEVHCPRCGEYVTPVAITEDKPVQNLSVYALSKYDAERISVSLGDALKIPTVAFRYSNVYGPRQSLSNPYTGVAAIFLSRAKNKNPPVIYEDGKQLRDFIYVEDVARANVAALEKDVSEVYNIGTGRTSSILDIANTITGIVGSNAEPRITQEFRAGDNRHDYADVAKARRELGFEARWQLKKGMEKLAEWSESEQATDMFEKAEDERRRYVG